MAEVEDDGEIFVYTGGEQVVPSGVRRVRIDKSVKIIPRNAFKQRRNLIYVEFHDGVEIIERLAFYDCPLSSSIKLLGVTVIEVGAFSGCNGLTDVEFAVDGFGFTQRTRDGWTICIPRLPLSETYRHAIER